MAFAAGCDYVDNAARSAAQAGRTDQINGPTERTGYRTGGLTVEPTDSRSNRRTDEPTDS